MNASRDMLGCCVQVPCTGWLEHKQSGGLDVLDLSMQTIPGQDR